MADFGSYLSEAGQNFARSWQMAQKQKQEIDLSDALFEMGSRMQMPDAKDPAKTKGIFDKQFMEQYPQMSRTKRAALSGYMQHQMETAQAFQQTLGRMQAAQELEDQSLSGQATAQRMKHADIAFPVEQATKELNLEQAKEGFPVEQGYKKASTAHMQEQTEASKEERAAKREEPMVMMDMGGNNYVPVPARDLIKHPTFLKDQDKDLNTDIFNATGLTLKQVMEGWNKKVVNGQLTFEAPQVQQTTDAYGRPYPLMNQDGTPKYILQPKNAKGEQLTATTTYQLPREYTKQVLRLSGTEGVPGAGTVDIPEERSKPSLVPKSAATGATTSIPKGTRGVVNGQPAIWDGQGWLPAP